MRFPSCATRLYWSINTIFYPRSILSAGLALVLMSGAAHADAASQSGTVTFADQDVMPNNSPLPAADYGEGLPTGVFAVWEGWLLHSTSDGTPISVHMGRSAHSGVAAKQRPQHDVCGLGARMAVGPGISRVSMKFDLSNAPQS